jgi:hypothetical protein
LEHAFHEGRLGPILLSMAVFQDDFTLLVKNRFKIAFSLDEDAFRVILLHKLLNGD